jgi:hypothetical protein
MDPVGGRGEVFLRPGRHLILLGEQDHLAFGGDLVEQVEDVAGPVGVGVDGDVVEDQRAGVVVP